MIGILLFLYVDSIALTQDMYDVRFVLDTVDGFIDHLTRDFQRLSGCFTTGGNTATCLSGKGFFMIVKLFFIRLVVVIPVFYIYKERQSQQQADQNENSFISAVC